jgi:hypothetical protein
MSDFNFAFRPASYWEHSTPLSAILSNIKGQNRRRMVRDYLTGVRRSETGIHPGYLEAELDEKTRSWLGSHHPSWMGGEYLPRYLPGEVEIARIALDSTTQDVISFRARRRRGGRRILYRVVDEYPEGADWTWRPASSAQPLTFPQVIALIDDARTLDLAEQKGSLPLLYLEMREGYEPEELLNFVTVESDFYPDLSAYYQQQAESWIRGQESASY